MKERPDLSILIPVYQTSRVLPSLLCSLCNVKSADVEIIVIVDEPKPEILDLKSKFKSVKFIVNGHRQGKANALNRALKDTRAANILFLDSDVMIKSDPDVFISSTLEALKHHDIVEYKEITRFDGSLRSKLIRLDDALYSFSYNLFSKLTGKCFALSGAAFAIKRRVLEELGGFQRVIQEDIDLGTRAFLKNKSFTILKDLEISVEPPNSWRSWLEQRKRWFMGYGAWLRRYFLHLLKAFILNPKMLLPIIALALVLSLPTLFSLTMVPSIISGVALAQLFKNIHMPLAGELSNILKYMLNFRIGSETMDALTCTLRIIICYLLYSAIFSIICKSVDVDFSLNCFLPYATVYAITTFVLLTVFLLKGVIVGDRSLPNWKI
ncbi:MAG: glycosyltransferase family 2 protein [Candidatus Nezhaarchaeales archaeon]